MTVVDVVGTDGAGGTEPRRGREFQVDLPVGYIDDDGRLHRAAALRKMTGHEEALLGDRKLRQNGGRLITELLAACLLRLGDVAPLDARVVSDLTSCDRNFLLLELRKVTFGSRLEATYACPSCRESTLAIEDLDDIPVRRVEGPTQIVVELDDGYDDRGELHTVLTFRLPTGHDEERVAVAGRDNPTMGVNALLTRCLISVGDMPAHRREALGTKVVTDLTLGDRARIERAFQAEMPGVDLTRVLQCDWCARPIRTSLDMTAFFSPA